MPALIFRPAHSMRAPGEGDVNAHSRVQMALGEAKAKAKLEFKKCLDETGYSLEEIKAYVSANDYLQRPFYKVGHKKGVIGVAANFVLDVAGKMKKDGIKTVVINETEKATA